MKLYYDSDGGPTWVEVTKIITFPIPQIRMDSPSQIIIEIRDFEGALYAIWSSRNFVDMKVTDGAETPTTLFRGFISNKKFKHKKLTIIISGFSAKLEHEPLHHNYVLEQGKVSEVPATIPEVNESAINPEAPDVSTQWHSDRPGNHWDALDGMEYNIYLDANHAANVDELNMETFVVAAVTKIRIYLNGYIWGVPNPPACPEVDVFLNGAWVGYKTVSIPEGEWGWAYAEYEGEWNQADLNALKVRIKATTGADQMMMVRRMYANIFYAALDLSVLGLEDLQDPPLPFEWAADYWNSGFQDKGILITDSTSGTISKTWDASACVITGHTTKDEAFAKVNTKNDDLYVWANEIEQPYNAVIDLNIDGVGVPTTHYLQRIEIDYQFGHWINPNGVSNSVFKTELQIKKDTTWITIRVYRTFLLPTSPSLRKWVSSPTLVIEDTHAELLKYFDTDNGNYDSLKGLRFVTSTPNNWEMGVIITEVDYISVRVYHNTLDIAPIMESIDDSEDHWIKTTGIDWTITGVAVGDNFKIGESTTQILRDISSISEIPFSIQSTLTKYIAQYFKGTYNNEILKKICLLEGLHWWEDHQEYVIVISKEADFVDSTVDLTQANYLWEWEFEDNCNYYKAVEVFGSAALGIYYKTPDENNGSPLVKSIIEETILTIPEAREIAETQLLEYKVKRPSIRIPLNGVQTNLGVGKTATLTMVRPTVGVNDYPIRMIERHKIGISGIKTIIWCGLGRSTWEENMADIVNKAMLLAHKAHTDRLISTPAGEGAVITWGVIGGRADGVRSIITTELIEDHSIDNAIDLLIAAKTHNSLQELNAGDAYEHISQAQKDALHAIYTLEVHSNTKHNPNYAAETRVFEQSAAFPAEPSEGDLHYDEDLDSLYRYNAEAEAWVEVGVGGLVAGSVDNLGNHSATQNLDMNVHKIIDLANCVYDLDATNKQYVDEADKDGIYSNDLVFSNDTERMKATAQNYIKIKEITVYRSLKLRVYWEAHTVADVTASKTRVYINGVAQGSEHSNTTENYVAFAENVELNAGDLLQIYGIGYKFVEPNYTPRAVYVRYMRIKFIEYVSNDP